jgi:DNA-binding CsgD family transcriptional regulator
MDEKRLFESLERISKLLAANVIQSKSMREQIKLLTDVGFTPQEISEITGTSANTIRVTKTLMKKKNGKKQ